MITREFSQIIAEMVRISKLFKFLNFQGSSFKQFLKQGRIVAFTYKGAIYYA